MTRLPRINARFQMTSHKSPDSHHSTFSPDVNPLHVTPEEWRAKVYQGDHVRQLSIRSVVTGMLLGGFMSISNLYVGMKTGWGLGVTITACVLAFGLYRILETIFPHFRDRPFTILENYTMSSAASAAGFMSSAGLVSAFPALTLTTGRELNWWELTAWLGCVSVLGVFMAVPLKRQLINLEQLPFPSGIATAETLKSMHSEGSDAVRKARSLIIAGLIGGLVKISGEGIPLLIHGIPNLVKKVPDKLGEILSYLQLPTIFPLIPFGSGYFAGKAKKLFEQYTIGFEGSTIMLAAGAIMGIRVGLSMLIGSIFFFGILAPQLLDQKIIEINRPEEAYRAIVYWTVWPATSMMVVASLLSFMFRWKTIFYGIIGTFRPHLRHSSTDNLEDIEVPMSWFLLGTLIPGTGCVILGHFLFDIRWDMGILAVLVTFILSVVAARATGETDITPIGAMGKITQLLYGVIAPSRITTNLMTASITSGAASHAADLLTDLKTGYLLGGNPRKQTISQLFGVFAGTVFCVPIYLLIVKKDKIGSAEMPFPSAKVWESVARLMNEGVQNLPPGALAAMLIGGIVGGVLACGEEFLPKKYSRWLPSVTGLGIAGVIPAYNSISMFLGALIVWIISKIAPKADAKYTISVSSGLIAGESLLGVAFMLLGELPSLFAQLSRILFGNG